MRIRVKICGLRTPEAVAAAVSSGADAIGFVFHPPSPRNIAPRSAGALARAVPPFIARVGVFRHPPIDLVDLALEHVGPDLAQSDAEDAELFDGLVPFLPVFRDGAGLAADVGRWRGGGQRPVMIEGPESGAGVTPDWSRIAPHALAGPVVLAGGLTPENVGDAIRRVRPYAVDVSSGVESAPGVKDPARIRAFVDAVRDAERAL